MAVVTLPGVARATSTTCATSAVCAEYINTYTSSYPVAGGVAIHGESNGGIGIRGTSVTNVGFYGASGSGMTIAPGVEGESTNTSGIDAGGGFGLGIFSGGKVPGYGTISYGLTYGALGVVTNPSTSADSPNAGVYAGDTSGTSSYNAALLANSNTQTGVLAESYGTPTQGLMGKLTIGLYAVAEPNSKMAVPNAVGIETESTSYPFEAYNSQYGEYVDIAHGSYLISGSAGSANFNITTSGNETLSGHLTTAGGTYVRKTGASGTKRIAYGAQMSAPEIEDVGEATLTNGRAFVSIDAALADSIDMRRPYHVFVTPDGDCKGLFVAERGPNGFVVRELQGGRTSLTFEYRIVAKPIDESGERLALAAPTDVPASAVTGRRVGRMPAPMTPDQRLRQRLGPQRYAAAIADLSRRLVGR